MASRELLFGVASNANQVRQFGDDRICRASACDVRLSRYNPGDHCGIHTRPEHELRKRRW